MSKLKNDYHYTISVKGKPLKGRYEYFKEGDQFFSLDCVDNNPYHIVEARDVTSAHELLTRTFSTTFFGVGLFVAKNGAISDTDGTVVLRRMDARKLAIQILEVQGWEVER